MVEAEEGNSWIYKNKDHGKECIVDFFLTTGDLTLTNRNVVCGCEPCLSLLWTPK